MAWISLSHFTDEEIRLKREVATLDCPGERKKGQDSQLNALSWKPLPFTTEPPYLSCKTQTSKTLLFYLHFDCSKNTFTINITLLFYVIGVRTPRCPEPCLYFSPSNTSQVPGPSQIPKNTWEWIPGSWSLVILTNVNLFQQHN